MAAVKSRGNASTELAFVNYLRERNISGWRRHTKINGIRPDFVFKHKNIAVFIDGCFWHACDIHLTLPATNRLFWAEKIKKNVARDKAQRKALRKNGWKVYSIWEHTMSPKMQFRILDKFRF